MEALNPNPETAPRPSAAESAGQLATHGAFIKDLFTNYGGELDTAGYTQFVEDQHL